MSRTGSRIPAIGVMGKTASRSLVAFDESEVSTTSTSSTLIKEFRLAKLSTVGNDWKKLIVLSECYNDTSGQTTYFEIYIDGNLKDTIEYSENTYTLKGTEIDISGLADGVHLVEFKLKVSGGTGYNRLVEAWVE